MPRIPPATLGSVVLVAIVCCVLPSAADDKPADKYNDTGTVLSSVSKHGHFYQVGTEGKVYLLLCTKVRGIQFGEPECKLEGKPIATGNTIHFRVEGDFAYMAPISGESMEEKLRILTTELKVIPPLPPAASVTTPATGKATNVSTESGVVVGTGTHIKGQKSGSWSTNPSPIAPGITTASPGAPVIATAPVTAIPVTGGAPVTVMPVGPTTGGVVTGVPLTGGAPITAIPTAPVAGVPVGGAPAAAVGPAAPQWVHILRIQTGEKIYQLECSSKPCTLVNKEIALGDALTIRIDKKNAFVSFNGQESTGQQQFKVLEVTDLRTTPESKPH